MEDVLDVYHRPHDPQQPVVFMDESREQGNLFGGSIPRPRCHAAWAGWATFKSLGFAQ